MEKKTKKDELFIYLRSALGVLATTLLMLEQLHVTAINPDIEINKYNPFSLRKTTHPF